jgi:uncharacterized protein YjeT (DUF2065 family)
MSGMQRIGLVIGLLVLATRLPAVIWPGPYRQRMRGFLLQSGPGVVRAHGAFLWAVVAAIVVLVLDRLSLLEAVLLILSLIFAATGAIALFAPDGYRRFGEAFLAEFPDWAFRAAGLVGVALGTWIIVLSLRSS